MLHRLQFNKLNGRVPEVLAHIKQNRADAQKRGASYTVIDVGGSMGGWSSEVATHLLDFNTPKNNGKFQFFQISTLNDAESWRDITSYTSKHGKFDFCICTHTLEDVAMPQLVVKMISRVAQAGFISTPSKYREFQRNIDNHGQAATQGYYHHRFIYSIVDNVWTAFPKLNFLESEPEYDAVASNLKERHELSFFWKKNISLHIYNNDYLGPSYDFARDAYKAQLLINFDDAWILGNATKSSSL